MAAAGLLGAVIGGAMQLGGTALQQKYNKRAARTQMKFQERMYKSRYQMTMEDMRLAGLNPILAYQQGPGSSPRGAAAQIGNPNLGTAAMAGAGTALKGARLNSELQVMKEQARKDHEQGNEAHERAWLNRGLYELNEQHKQTEVNRQYLQMENWKQLQAQVQIMQAQVPSARTQYKLDKTWIGKRSKQWELLRRRFLGSTGVHAGAGASRNVNTSTILKARPGLGGGGR